MGGNCRRTEFLRLAKSNEQTLVRCARRLCGGDWDRAADCVQEAIVSAYKAFESGKFQDDENFRPWIMRILMNAFLLDERRRRRSVVSEDVTSLVESRQNPKEAQPEDLLLDGLFSEEVELALSTLAPEQLACVTLVDVESMDYAEAARTLDIPIGTVRSRLARARLKLANEILRHRQGAVDL